MALQATVDFRLKTAANPASPPSGWSAGTGSNAAAYVNRGEIGWEAKANQSLWYYTTPMQGDVIESEVTAGLQITASIGAAIVDINGNGYMLVNNSSASSLRIFLVVASQASGIALGNTYNIPMTAGQKIKLVRTVSTDTYQIYINGTLIGSYTPPVTIYNPTYGALRSGYGSVRQVDIYYTPDQAVTSINGGSPFTASQTTSSAVTTGFTGLPSSITATWGAYSIPITGISGSTNAPTFIKAVRVDGNVYPKSGEILTLTFINGSETAGGTQTFNKDSDEVELAVTAPIINDPKYLFGAIYAATGRTAVTGDYGYYKVPVGMSDLTIGVDGRIQSTNAGTFQYWAYTAATGVNYYYSVTITENGVVIGGGLTSSGLTSSGLTIAGLISTGL